MTQPFDIDAMRADMEAATSGPWWTDVADYGTSSAGGAYVGVYRHDGASLAHVLCSDFVGTRGEWPYAANARRIARVPAMEAEILRLTAEVKRLREALTKAESTLARVASSEEFHCFADDGWDCVNDALTDTRTALGETP